MIFAYLQDGKGNDVDLATYKGKVLLIVNVASKWYVVCTLLFFSF
jgi:glutathione peroxidase-family protein